MKNISKNILYAICLYFVNLYSVSAGVFPITYISCSNDVPYILSKAFIQVKKTIIERMPGDANKTLQIIGFQSINNLFGRGTGWYIIVRVLDSPKATSIDNIMCLGVIATTNGTVLQCVPTSEVAFCYPITNDILGMVNIDNLASPRHEFLGHELDVNILLGTDSGGPLNAYSSESGNDNIDPSEIPPPIYSVYYFSDFNHSGVTQILVHQWLISKGHSEKWIYLKFGFGKNQYLEALLSDELRNKYIAETNENSHILSCELYPAKVYDLSKTGIKILGLNADDVIDGRMANIR